MTKKIKSHHDRLPTTPQEVAAAGLRTAIQRVADRNDNEVATTERLMANYLNCDVHQLRYYARKEGLPVHFVESALTFFRMHDVPVARYQLKPTRAVLTMYGLENDA